MELSMRRVMPKGALNGLLCRNRVPSFGHFLWWAPSSWVNKGTFSASFPFGNRTDACGACDDHRMVDRSKKADAGNGGISNRDGWRCRVYDFLRGGWIV